MKTKLFALMMAFVPANLVLVPGCTVILRNGGVINMAVGKSFEAPVGAVVNIESGEIN